MLQLVTAAGNDPIRSPWLLSLFSFPGSQEPLIAYIVVLNITMSVPLVMKEVASLKTFAFKEL